LSCLRRYKANVVAAFRPGLAHINPLAKTGTAVKKKLLTGPWANPKIAAWVFPVDRFNLMI
jgi:hypothetical protein